MTKTILGFCVFDPSLIQGGEKVYVCPCSNAYIIAYGRYHKHSKKTTFNQSLYLRAKRRYSSCLAMEGSFKVKRSLRSNGSCPTCKHIDRHHYDTRKKLDPYTDTTCMYPGDSLPCGLTKEQLDDRLDEINREREQYFFDLSHNNSLEDLYKKMESSDDYMRKLSNELMSMMTPVDSDLLNVFIEDYDY